MFEKLRRFATREGIELVLADVDRPELKRVVNITLYGEDKPTFAFVDRVGPSPGNLNPTGDILASDETGRVVQVRRDSQFVTFPRLTPVTRLPPIDVSFGGPNTQPHTEPVSYTDVSVPRLNSLRHKPVGKRECHIQSCYNE